MSTIRNDQTQTKATQGSLTPSTALNLLKEGNKRFVNKDTFNRDHLGQVKETSTGQFPFAAVLSCIDSRVPAEMVFDQGIGDIFSIRIAGNFINDDILGSMEFACKVAGSKTIVVLGHSSCGAVKGACDHVELGNLTGMLEKIQPAVSGVTDVTENRNSSNAEFVQKVSNLNVELAMKDISERSPVLNEMIQNGEISVVGAMYHVTDGHVEFFD